MYEARQRHKKGSLRGSAGSLPPISRRSRHGPSAVFTPQPTTSATTRVQRTPSNVAPMQRQGVEQSTIHNEDASAQPTTSPPSTFHSVVDRPAKLAPTSSTASGSILTAVPSRRDVPTASSDVQNNQRLSVLRESFESFEPSGAVSTLRSSIDGGKERNNDSDQETAAPRQQAHSNSDT